MAEKHVEFYYRFHLRAVPGKTALGGGTEIN